MDVFCRHFMNLDPNDPSLTIDHLCYPGITEMLLSYLFFLLPPRKKRQRTKLESTVKSLQFSFQHKDHKKKVIIVLFRPRSPVAPRKVSHSTNTTRVRTIGKATGTDIKMEEMISKVRIHYVTKKIYILDYTKNYIKFSNNL